MKLKHVGSLLFALALVTVAATRSPKRVEPSVTYAPFAVGAVRLVNGVGVIEHPKLDWDSIPVFSLYTPGAPGATITVCWAVTSRMEICSSDPDDDALYTFAIYDGKSPGIIFPK